MQTDTNDDCLNNRDDWQMYWNLLSKNEEEWKCDIFGTIRLIMLAVNSSQKAPTGLFQGQKKGFLYQHLRQLAVVSRRKLM